MYEKYLIDYITSLNMIIVYVKTICVDRKAAVQNPCVNGEMIDYKTFFVIANERGYLCVIFLR